MLLIGMFDSPFVRRVAISMKLLGIQFEHAIWSVGKDFDRIREHNPLGRVPTLVLNDGEALIESAAILDYIDELAGERALLPRSGKPRRAALRLMATATGAADKGVLLVYERAFREPQMRSAAWTQRCETQVHGALTELEKACARLSPGEWLLGSRMTQADITVACVFTFLSETLPLTPQPSIYPRLRSVVERCEALPVFREIKQPFYQPNS